MVFKIQDGGQKYGDLGQIKNSIYKAKATVLSLLS